MSFHALESRISLAQILRKMEPLLTNRRAKMEEGSSESAPQPSQ